VVDPEDRNWFFGGLKFEAELFLNGCAREEKKEEQQFG
jgi:hypothetical protein